MKRIKIFSFVVFIFVFSLVQGGNIIMAEENIQMGQTNSSNTAWNNHYPITKAENVKLDNGDNVAAALEDNIAQLNNVEVNKRDKTTPLMLADLHTEVKAAMTGGSVAVVGTNAIGAENVKRNSLIPQHTDFVKTGKNLLNPIKLTAGGYYAADGSFVSNANFSYIVVPVLPSTTYSTSLLTDTIWVNYLDVNKAFLSGIITNNGGKTNVFTTPVNCYYLILSSTKTYMNALQLEAGSASTKYENYYQTLTYENLDKTAQIYSGNIDIDFVKKLITYKSVAVLSYDELGSTSIVEIPDSSKNISVLLNSANFLFKITVTNSGIYFKNYGDATTADESVIGIYNRLTSTLTNIKDSSKFFTINSYPYRQNIQEINLKTDGTGHFTTLKNALNYTSGSTINRKYIIHIYEGDYNAFEGYTEAEIKATTFIGAIQNDYVDIIGEGDYMKIKLIGRLDSAIYDTATQFRVSPLNIRVICNVSNISIIAKNTRYCIHDDYNTGVVFAQHKYKDLYLYKEAGGGLPKAYGAGCTSGALYEFENVTAISEIGCPFSIHNSGNQNTKCKFILKNVKAYNLGHNPLAHPSDRASIMFPSENSNTDDEVTMIGCDFPDGIYQYSEVPLDGVKQINNKITGFSNSMSPNIIANTDSRQYYIDFHEEISHRKAGVPITKGQPLKYTDNKMVAPMLTSDSTLLCIGIALTDSATNVNVAIRYAGYLQQKDTAIATLNLGDKVGIVNGVLTVVTSGDYIGVCTLTGFIKMSI